MRPIEGHRERKREKYTGNNIRNQFYIVTILFMLNGRMVNWADVSVHKKNFHSLPLPSFWHKWNRDLKIKCYLIFIFSLCVYRAIYTFKQLTKNIDSFIFMLSIRTEYSNMEAITFSKRHFLH